MVFVFINEKGENDFSFYGEPSADKLLDKKDVTAASLRGCTILHHGSISFMRPDSAAATRKAIMLAKKAGALISFDPNVRLNLWKEDYEASKKQIVPLFKTADIIKLNEKELKFLFGGDIYQSDLEKIFKPGQLVFITSGAKGCIVKYGSFYGCVPGKKVKAVDTTGAGDAFMAGVLTGIINTKKGLEMSPAQLLEIAVFANKQGADAVLKRGAV